MQCHYELLGVSRDAGEDEIKKSYRKLALQWHPDKNPDRVEECTKHFLKLQQAYEVLSDPQERAWYDKHREAILRGGLGHGDQYKDSCLDVYQYFNTSCYSGFGDDENGFYAVYAEVFKKIANEDREFVELGEGEVYRVPEFGNSMSNYEEVVGPFYAYWESYCTARSYVWAEKYDTREAPNRQIRRLMEQDNKKLRDKARKERNEEVRALVSYVRKRDRRVQAYKKRLEERATEIARLAEEKKQRDKDKRRKARENYKESEWSSMSALEQQLKALESSVAAQFGDEDDYTDESDVEGSEEDLKKEEADADDIEAAAVIFEPVIDLYCVACNKQFKSDKALENHCQSRKHCENVELIKAEMEADESILKNTGTAHDNDDVVEQDQPSDDELDLNTSSSRSKRSKKQKKKQRQMDRLMKQTQDPNDDDEDDSAQITSKADHHLETADENLTSSQNEKTAETNHITVSDSTTTEDHSDLTSADITSTATTADSIDGTAAEAVEDSTSTQVLNKSQKLKSSQTKAENSSSAPVRCNKCRQMFPTRNKLFDHIKATGHALRIDEDNSSASHTTLSSAAGGKKKEKGKKAKR